MHNDTAHMHTHTINWFWSTDSCFDTNDFLGSGSTLRELKAIFASAADGNGAVNTLWSKQYYLIMKYKSYLDIHMYVNEPVKIKYRIMQIICGGKLLLFLQISLQSLRFSSKFFLFYYKVFRIAVQSQKFSREWQEDRATAKLLHRERFALYGIWKN